jgi:transposase
VVEQVRADVRDAVDAKAICEAVQRPNMRFVAVKTEEQQGSALVFRTHNHHVHIYRLRHW